MIVSPHFPCWYITSCFLSILVICSKLCFSSLCSLLMSLSTSLRRLSQASLALLYSILSFSLCLLVASCACSSSARSCRHSWSRFFKQTGKSRREQGIRLIHKNRNTASSLTNLTCPNYLQQFGPGHDQQHVCATFLSVTVLLQGYQILKGFWSTECEAGAAGAHLPLCTDVHKLVLVTAGLGQVSS